MLPSCVRYNQIKPRGFATKCKRWQVNPQSSYNTFSKNELIRFVIDSDGFVDPYKIYVDVVVSTSSALQTNPGVIMLDGPSTSLFQTLTIYSNSKQIERIDEYDQLGNILRDIQYDPVIEQNRQYEGYAFNSLTRNTFRDSGIGLRSEVIAKTTAATPVTAQYQGRFRPYLSMKQAINAHNFNLNDAADGTVGKTFLDPFGLTASATFKNRFDLHYQEMDTEFGIDVGDTKSQGFLLNSTPALVDTKIEADKYGYVCPYSQSLNRGKSAYMCPIGQKLKVVNGKFIHGDEAVLGGAAYDQTTSEKYTTSKLRLIVPLLSGTIGVLIPRDQWKLLPMQAFKQLMFEFRLNPYAFFSAGLKAATAGEGIKANWKVESIQMVFDIWYFDQAITNQINQALNGEGIIISSQAASMGPMYNIIANGTVTNNWQLNNGIESCKALYFWFLDNRYQKYDWCRKNFRISQNLKSIQLKVGPDWVPPYPIQGNSGNIGLNNDASSIDGDNTEFLLELQKSFNRLFDCNDNISIDKLNFAINERTYDPSAVTNTQYGSALWEEMRCQGKALYSIALDQNPFDPDTLSGLDTTKVRPIELVIKGTDLNKFGYDSTMYVMYWHDFYVQLTNEGVNTFGQG